MKALFYLGFIALAIPSAPIASKAEQPSSQGPAVIRSDKETDADIQASLAELSKEDRKLAEAQKFCPIMTKYRLGIMGPPVKVMIKDQPIFLCCKGCRTKALAKPDKTLATVAELKAKVKADSTNR